jgi:hypothetical protein
LLLEDAEISKHWNSHDSLGATAVPIMAMNGTGAIGTNRGILEKLRRDLEFHDRV